MLAAHGAACPSAKLVARMVPDELYGRRLVGGKPTIDMTFGCFWHVLFMFYGAVLQCVVDCFTYQWLALSKRSRRKPASSDSGDSASLRGTARANALTSDRQKKAVVAPDAPARKYAGC